MSTVLAGHEKDMKTAADSGWYPHGLEGKNKIAYISYNVVFPAGAAIGETKTSNTSSFVDGNKILSSVDGQTVKFKIYLTDTNWEGIYKAYQKDQQDPKAHTVNLKIPYTVTAASTADAQKLETATLTGSGSFSFYISGTMAAGDMNATTYVSDTASQPLAAGMSDCFKEPVVKKTTKRVTETGESLKDPVVGDDFEAVGTIEGYDFVTESFSEDGITKTYTFKKNTEPTDAIPEGKIEAKISADLEGSVDGGKTGVYNTRTLNALSKDSVFSATGVLHVNDIVKGQMDGIIKKYDENPNGFDDIKLSDVTFAFDATLTLSDGLKFADAANKAPIDVVLKGAGDSFAVKSTEVNGQKATVKMGLKNEVKTFAQLKRIIDTLDEDLKVTIDNITFSGTAKPDTTYTMTGTANGTFTATAAKDELSRSFKFVYEGTNDKGLLLNVQYIKPVESGLLADIQGRRSGAKEWDTTTKDILRVPSEKDAVDVQGVLHVGESIKNQMKAIEDQYQKVGKDFTKIKLDTLRFGFRAKLTLPDGMAFTTTEKDKLTLEGTKDFDFAVSASSKEIVVDFVLKDPSAIKTYADLKKVIDPLEDDLKITVPGVKFTKQSESASPLPWYTIEGEASGTFSANATFGTKTIPFSFLWNGKQKSGEEDRYVPSGIKFTVQPGIEMPADLRGAQTGKELDTENKQVYVVDSKDSTMDLAGVLHIKDAVIEKMKSIENWKNVPAGTFDSIKLAGTEFGFDAKLTLPTGMKFTDTDVDKLDLSAKGFVVSKEKTSFDGNVLNVHFDIKDPTSIDTYGDLKNLVAGAGVNNDLRITVHGVAFADDSKADTNYTITGEVSGEFKSNATLSSTTIPFGFTWTGVQHSEEADFAAPTGINFTVKYKATPTPEPKPTGKTSLARTGSETLGVSALAGLLLAAGASLVASRRVKK